MLEFYIYQLYCIDDNVEIGNNIKNLYFFHVLKGTKTEKYFSFGQNCVIGPNVIISNEFKVQNDIAYNYSDNTKYKSENDNVVVITNES